MTIDSRNAVVALCAEGMAHEGDAPAAKRLFEEAWAARQDDYEASIAAHYLARHQSTIPERVRWNALAVEHAEAVTDGRTDEFKSSLYLNLADAHLAAGDFVASRLALQAARANVSIQPDGGYRTFVERGISGLARRVAAAEAGAQKI